KNTRKGWARSGTFLRAARGWAFLLNALRLCLRADLHPRKPKLGFLGNFGHPHRNSLCNPKPVLIRAGAPLGAKNRLAHPGSPKRVVFAFWGGAVKPSEHSE